MTVKQIAKPAELDLDCCSDVLWELSVYRVVLCLTPNVRRSRVYGVTRSGVELQQVLRRERGLPDNAYFFPRIDWELYAWTCFSHRSMVLRVLSEVMQASAIKRKARRDYPGIRMSANNVRDVLYLFVQRRIVEKVYLPRQAHVRYKLTDVGKALQHLLLEADMREPGISVNHN